MPPRPVLIVSLLLLLLFPAASAGATIYSRVLHAYETTGTITPCEFSSAQLATALKGVDTYGAQYFADFTNAIQSAMSQRGAGACSHTHPAAAAAATKRTGAEGSLTLGPVTASTDADLPAPILLMAALGAAFGLLAIVGAVARMRGWDPAWAATWRHAWAEAGDRTGATWAEFVDWLRSNR